MIKIGKKVEQMTNYDKNDKSSKNDKNGQKMKKRWQKCLKKMTKPTNMAKWSDWGFKWLDPELVGTSRTCKSTSMICWMFSFSCTSWRICISCASWKSISWMSWNSMGTSMVQLDFVIRTIRPQTPLSLKEGSYLCVNWHKRSIAPLSTMGSLEGENSSSKLQRVLEAKIMHSTEELEDSKIEISGFQTGWSWK